MTVGSDSLAPKLYVMDNDTELASVYANLAQSLESSVQWLDDCRQLNSLLQSETLVRPSCMIVDLHQPDLESLVVSQTLNQQQSYPPTVFVGASPGTPAVVDAMMAGGWAVMLKPLNVGKLQHHVANALEHDRLWTEMEVKYRKLTHVISTLTPRQQSVLEQVSDGSPTKLIAKKQGVSQRLVESERSALIKAFDVGSTPQLTRLMGEFDVLGKLWSRVDRAQSPVARGRARRDHHSAKGMEPNQGTPLKHSTDEAS